MFPTQFPHIFFPDLVPQPVLLDDSLKLLHHVLGSAVVLLGCGEVQEAGHAERACCVAQEVMALGARPTVKRHLQVDGFRHLAVHLQLGLDVAGEQQTASQLR